MDTHGDRLQQQVFGGRHPMDIRGDILEQLGHIEQEHGVRIPIAVESGSRAWGFPSPDSDYDCRFLYVRPRDWYLSVFERGDTIEYTPDAVFDVAGWDVRKAIQHLVKSNAVMHEWLSSGTTYRTDRRVHSVLWELAKAFFNPVAVCWHYLSMARGKLAAIEGADTAKIKAYCYVLRPLACIRHVHAYRTIPHMDYLENMGELSLPDALRTQIRRLLHEKETAAESYPIARDELLLSYFRQEIAWTEKWLPTQKHEKNRDYESADRAFRDILGMVNGNG